VARSLPVDKLLLISQCGLFSTTPSYRSGAMRGGTVFCTRYIWRGLSLFEHIDLVVVGERPRAHQEGAHARTFVQC